MGQNCGVKFRRQCDNHSQLISKSNQVGGKSMKEKRKRNDAWLGVARTLAPGYPNKHICREIVAHNQNGREWGHFEHNPK